MCPVLAERRDHGVSQVGGRWRQKGGQRRRQENRGKHRRQGPKRKLDQRGSIALQPLSTHGRNIFEVAKQVAEKHNREFERESSALPSESQSVLLLFDVTFTLCACALQITCHEDCAPGRGCVGSLPEDCNACKVIRLSSPG